MIKKGNRTLSVICAAAMVMSGLPVNTVHAEEPAKQQVEVEISSEEETTQETSEAEGSEETDEAETETEVETETETETEVETETVTETEVQTETETESETETDEKTTSELDSSEEVVVGKEAGSYEFAASDLKVLAKWGTEEITTEEGKYAVNFEKQYSQIFYALPEGVDGTRIEKITVDADPANFSVKLALNDSSYTEAGIVYGNNVLTKDKFKTDVDLTNATVICLMRLSEGEDVMTKEINSITLELSAATSGEETKPSTSKPAESLSFAASDLKVLAKWGTEEITTEEGKYAVEFPKQYNQIFYAIPENVDPTRIEKITVDVDPANFSVKLALNDSSYTEAGIVYGNNVLTKDKFKEDVDLSNATVLCLMRLSEGEDTMVKEIGNITFDLAAVEGEEGDDIDNLNPSDNVKPISINKTTGEYVFNASDLIEAGAFSATSEVLEDGTLRVTFPGQYSQLFLDVPEVIDVTKLASVAVGTDSSHFSVKFCKNDTDFTELGVTYGNTVLNVEQLHDGTAADIEVVGLMNLNDAEAVKDIKTITFKMQAKQTEADKSVGDLTADCFKEITNNNPLVTQRYSADPGVMVYNDTVYIYSTNDIYEYKNGKLDENTYGKIKTINCFSSTDLVNWTDHGAIQVAGKNNEAGAAKWANNSWAPCAAHKTIDGKEKFFLYFADNGSGIGVLTSDSPTGPWVDPLGKQLISRSTPTCDTVEWLFDPAVLVDDDGTGYLYFGGGVPQGKADDPGTARVVKLGEDMISLDGDPVQINPPYLFEDSGINKIGDKYYYSYCSNWNCVAPFRSGTIHYMVSDNPMGPFTHVGEVFANPSSFFNDGNGNNHHSFFEFKGEMYLAYHARALERAAIGKALGYRSTQIDKVTVNDDGTLAPVTGTMEGVAQIGSVNPYTTHEATMMARQKGVEVLGEGDTVVTVTKDDFTGIKGVDFKGGISEIEMTVKTEEAMKIEVRVGNEKGSLIGTINVEPTDGEFKTFKTATKNVAGTASLYFVYGGSAEVKSWKASTDYLYTFDKLEEVEHYNLGYEINKDGSLTINYENKWGEIRFAVPEGLDLSKLSKIVLNVRDKEHGTMAVKALPTFGGQVDELAVAYGATEVETSGISDKSAIKYIGIMTMDDEPFEVTIDSVTFEMDSVSVNEGAPSGIQEDIPDLRDAMTEALGQDDFLVGTAICVSDLSDKKEMALVTKHFNAITFGNELKPDSTFGYSNSKCPNPHIEEFNGEELLVPTLDFSRGDKLLEEIYKWNEEHPEDFIKIRGHVLTWHSQTPDWFFYEDYDTGAKKYVDKETMTKRHEWYIKNVLEHYCGPDSKYKDMFYGWDVVNEAVSDGRGTYRNDAENSKWWAVYGSQEFIINAFKFANKYAPANVELYYNDYNECVPSKVKGIVQLLKDVKNAEGTRIDGMGMQGHYSTGGSPNAEDFKSAARQYAAVVGKVQLTELDFTASNAYDGTEKTAAAENTKLAYRYKEIYDSIKELRAEGINFTGMTVWGVVDKYSWLQSRNDVGGGTDGSRKHIPLLFDNDYQAKAAYWVFVDDKQLAPQIKSFDILQSDDNSFANANQLEVGTAVVAPIWNKDGIKVQFTVEDTTKDDADAVVVYVDNNGKIEKYEVARKDATETENGYVAVVEVPVTGKVSGELNIDFVVVNGANKYAFNDYTLSQATSKEYYAKAIFKPFMTISKGTVVVDGSIDEAWNNVTSVPLTINLGSNVTADAKLLWDAENLYVYASVKDSVLNADSTAAHEKDSIEVFIDENNHKSSKYEEDDKQYRVNYLNEQSFNGTKCVASNIQSAVTIADDGYDVELALKWTDITPKAGDKIGLELQINDANDSGKRSGTLSWYDTTGSGWEKPGVFGTVVLVDENGEVPEEPSTEEPSTEEPSTEEPSTEEPSTEEPSTEEPSTEEPSTEEPSTGNSGSEQSSSDNQGSQIQTPAVSEPIIIIDPETALAQGIEKFGFSCVDLTDKASKGILRQALLEKYVGKTVTLLYGVSKDLGFTVDSAFISAIGNADINLNMVVEKKPGFAEGFDTVSLKAKKNSVLAGIVGIHVNVGTENAGHVAYIFKKSVVTGQFEFVNAVLTNENGNVAIMTNEITDYMVLVQK